MMNDDDHYDKLKDRVTRVEERVSVVERDLSLMREEIKQGFVGLAEQLQNLYGERKEWSKWLRENLGRVIRWAAWIILAACGINQTSAIVKIVMCKWVA